MGIIQDSFSKYLRMGNVLKGGKEIAYGLNSKTINYTYVITFPAQDEFPLQFNVQESLTLLQFITFFRS